MSRVGRRSWAAAALLFGAVLLGSCGKFWSISVAPTVRSDATSYITVQRLERVEAGSL